MSNFTNQKMSAIRIKVVPPGTVVFETIVERNCEGLVTKEPAWGDWSPTKMSKTPDKPIDTGGLVLYTSKDGTKKSIGFSPKSCVGGTLPALGDKVEFNVAQVKRSKELKAVDVRADLSGNSGSLVLPTPVACLPQPSNNVQVVNNNHITVGNSKPAVNGAIHQGYIAALKDGFGFIETHTHDSEVFFHFSNFEGDASSLELGCEVEYTVGSRTSSGGSCASAENVNILQKGTIAPHVTIGEEILSGKVVRPLRSVNPEQAAYCGVITTALTDEEGATYDFGITGLSNKRELLQVGDPVQFQVDSEGRAVNISAVRKKKKSTVDSIKGQFGFLSYELEEGKKLFFHITEVKDGTNLQAGDSVEFVVVTNQRNGKSFACNVSKLPDGCGVPAAARPERLMIRRSVPSGDDGGPKLVVVRQPRGPSEASFSKVARSPRPPGHLPLVPLTAE
uniref:Cold shock domain-containing protein E1 n=1 Tax=Lygus hesperus TaxID=30085 RepID=A0A0A9YVF5_LYGHE